MAQASPINIKAISKKGILNEDRFYRLLSEQNNYMSPKLAKEFYLGLVRVLSQELRTKGVVRMPHLGDLALVKQSPKFGLSGKVRTFLEGKYMLKFYPNPSWRKYFSKLQDRPGREGMLDPREKVLNQDLRTPGTMV